MHSYLYQWLHNLLIFDLLLFTIFFFITPTDLRASSIKSSTRKPPVQKTPYPIPHGSQATYRKWATGTEAQTRRANRKKTIKIKKINVSISDRRRYPSGYADYKRVTRKIRSRSFDRASRRISVLFPLKNPASCLARIDFAELFWLYNANNEFREQLKKVIKSNYCSHKIRGWARIMWKKAFGKLDNDMKLIYRRQKYPIRGITK